jgi:hypothetical protein
MELSVDVVICPAPTTMVRPLGMEGKFRFISGSGLPSLTAALNN